MLPFHPLFYLPHSQKVYSLPRFAIFLSSWQMAQHKCTIHLFEEEKILDFCFLFNLLVWQQQWLQLVDNSSFGEASCLLWVGGALHWGWAGNIASC